jgi:ribosome recycling factor
MEKNTFLNALKTRMDSTIKTLDHDLQGLRTGRASINILDPIRVEIYGSRMSIDQLGTATTPDAKTVQIQVWDKANVKTIEKAIVESGIGLSPSSDGQVIRLSIPTLSQERRQELSKLCGKYGENSKIAIRNIRRDGMDELKKAEKDSKISKDEHLSLIHI